VAPLPFFLPWLHLELLIRSIRSTRLDADTWPIIKVELVKAVRMREVLRRAGWWN